MASASDPPAHPALQPADQLILPPQQPPAAVETSIGPPHCPAEGTQSDAFVQPSLRARQGHANSDSLFVLYRASRWVAPAGHDPVTETSAPPQPAMHVLMATDLTARAPTLAVGSGDADGSARAVVSGDARALVFVADCALPSRPVRFVGWWISPPASSLRRLLATVG